MTTGTLMTDKANVGQVDVVAVAAAEELLRIMLQFFLLWLLPLRVAL